jgi:uridine phosphorylase
LAKIRVALPRRIDILAFFAYVVKGETSLALEPRDSEGRLYHVRLRKQDVGKIALLPGDPDRVSRIAKRFADAKLISSHREYTTYGGYIDGEYVISMSTGIGGPAAAIAIEELARLGVKLMIRVGTCGAINPRAKVGSLIIADAAVRLDGTTRQYVIDGYPASATPEVVIALKESASTLKKDFISGISASTDAFYVGQGRPGYNNYFPRQAKGLFSDLRAANVLCFEMESSTLFTLGRIFGVRTGALFAVLGNRMTDDFRAQAGIDDSIEVALEGVRRLIKHRK